MADTALRSAGMIRMATTTFFICGFDISLPLGRARLLASLNKHAELFNEVERSAYDALRDELVRIARGEGKAEKADEYAKSLERFVGTAPARDIEEKPAPLLTPLASVVVEVPTPEAVPAPLMEQKGPVVQGFMRRVRGPDIPKTAVASASVAVQTEAPASPVTLPSEVILPVATATPAPDVSEVASPVSVPLPPQVELSVAKPESTPAVSSVAPASMREEVEAINESLIELGHGRAFQWLSDPKTGYREYMAELLAIRDALGSSNTASDPSALRLRIDSLREKAKVVQAAVGDVGSATALRQPAAVPVQTSVETTPSEPIRETPHSIEAEASLSPEPTPESVSVPVVAAPLPVATDIPQVPFEPTPELDSAEIPAPLPTVVAGPTPAPDTNDQTSIPESAPIPATPSSEVDPLHTREVDAGLTDLLTRWLGTTGFLGFGDSGMKHPEWIIMKTLMVDDVLVDDGTRPAGLRPDTYKNLGENIRAWRSAYGLMVEDRELVEHFIRRVVSTGLSQRT